MKSNGTRIIVNRLKCVQQDTSKKKLTLIRLRNGI